MRSPTKLDFVLFIFVHAVLALRNLNRMYAATALGRPELLRRQLGRVLDFTSSILVIAGALAPARPFVLAPIARLVGKVSGR